jgi:exodeoxyribonuclease VII small subunit
MSLPMDDANTQPTFEQSLARLHELVDQLEDGQLSLAQSLAAYEEGIKHLQICHSALTETERKIEILSGFNAAGAAITRPFDDTASDHEQNVGRRSREKRVSSKPIEPDRPAECDELDGRRELF